jgi:uncharacterized protein (TIGR00661 family)
LPEKVLNINILNNTKKILIAPLDWGLGHATRCIPIINELQAQGFEIFIAAEGKVAALLQLEFKHIEILPLKGYHVTYSKQKLFFMWNMFLQIPKIWKAIKQETTRLEQIIIDYNIDIVISDNRFGLTNKNAHCIFITHQLYIKTGSVFSEKIAQKINYHFINKFDECWVIDEAGENNLAGDLSHPTLLPKIPLHYISALSRFKKVEREKKIDILAVLSGPEPQRTIFENILLAQMSKLSQKMILVRGLPNTEQLLKTENNNLKIINYLPANELNELVLSAKVIVARSGYTSVMDYAILQKRVIFIPTPGQAEQEYLAKYLSSKKYCIIAEHNEFNLQKSLVMIENIELVNYPNFGDSALKKVINNL